MNNYRNLLINGGFDYKKFLAGQNESDWLIINLKGIKDRWREILKGSFNNAVVGYSDLNERLLVYFIKVLLIFTKSTKKYFIDNQGRKEYLSFPKFLFIDTPWFLLEIIFDLLLVIFSWLGLVIFNLIPKRKKLINLQNSSLEKRKKIIIYLRTDNFKGMQQGGSFTHFRGVVKGFYQLGYKVYYIGSGEIEIPTIDLQKTIILYPKKFNLPEIPEIYYNWRFVPKALKIIKQKKPLFIYQRHSIFNVCGAVLSQLSGIPLILEYNGSEPWVRQKWGGLLILKRLCYFMENFSLRKANLIVVVSDVLKEELLKRGIKENKILVNYNGVDPEEFNPNINGLKIRKKYNLENKIVIGAVSTFGVWHGMPVLAKSVKAIIQKFQIPNSKFQIHFLFIGDGVQRPECERIIRKDRMENYVTFTGIVPYNEVPKYLAACDILVSPHVPNPDGSEFFGSPTKIFEYMAMGKPIVASNLGQIGEILEDKKTALLIEPNNIDKLVEALIILIENKDLQKELGKNARNKVIISFSWIKNVEKLVETFNHE